MSHNYIVSLLRILSDFVHSLSWPGTIGLAIAIACILPSIARKRNVNIRNVPVHGYTSIFEPTFVLQWRFVLGARHIIASGYKKFKATPFIVRRFDTDYNILPIRYLEEIRLVSPAILSSKIATTYNMLYEWTDLYFLKRSDLHTQVLKNKVAPELSNHLEKASDELDYGWQLDVPQHEDWVEVDIQEIARMLVARMSARIFVGKPACRDPKWLRVCLDFTIDAFTTAFLLRMFPTGMRFIAAWFIPSRYRLKRHRAKAASVVRDFMKRHKDLMRRKGEGEDVKNEETLLDWMFEKGDDEETTVTEMANRQLIMTLASVHTTSTNTATFLFELCAHPEWVTVLRDEIEDVKRQTGDASKTDIKRWHRQLERMDSFLLECFRLHPPILLSPQRVALQPYTLKDGVHIPKGCRIAFANAEHQMDPEVTADPHTFDPMRSYRKRHSASDQYDRNQAVLTDLNNNLTFGYGNQSCPGRFLGVAEIKMLLSRLILEFDFRYPEGKSMPQTLSADENVFLDPRATLMMRKRKRS
ncbi:cytochrome P450 [Xylariaceae sp. FL0255]|nr:cytochrome P450 [Xylariaceae sp. FL0255]